MTPIERAASLLREGSLVAFPTETVYGLGADAANPVAVAKIFSAKGRPADHPLIVHLPGDDYLDRWARDIPDLAYELAEVFWPGPLTLILKRAAGVCDAVTGGQDTVGLRVPGHPLALELLRSFAGGVAAPSANRFGRVSPTTAQHVREELGASVGMVLDGGPCRVGIESTILDLSGEAPALLRPGMIGMADLARVLGEMPQLGRAGAPRVSGSLTAHYAPRTPLQLVAAADIPKTLEHLAGVSVAVFSPDRPPDREGVVWHPAAPEPAGFAHDLYAALRALDEMGYARIIVQRPPADAAWQAVNDRLQRAAVGSGAGKFPL